MSQTIRIQIKGQTFEVSREEAQALRNALDGVLGKDQPYVPYWPQDWHPQPDVVPTTAPWTWPGGVTCKQVTATDLPITQVTSVWTYDTPRQESQTFAGHPKI